MTQEAGLLQRQGAVHAGLVAVAEAEHVLGVGVGGGPVGHQREHVVEGLVGNVHVDVLLRNGEGLQHAGDGAVATLAHDLHALGPDDHQFGLGGIPALLLGEARQVAAGFDGSLEVVGTEVLATGVRTVPGDAGQSAVDVDARDQLLGAGDPVGEDDAVRLLGDDQVGALDRLLLVVGVVAENDVHAHGVGDLVDAVGHRVGERDAGEAVGVADRPALGGGANDRLVVTRDRLHVVACHVGFGLGLLCLHGSLLGSRLRFGEGGFGVLHRGEVALGGCLREFGGGLRRGGRSGGCIGGRTSVCGSTLRVADGALRAGDRRVRRVDRV